MTKRKLVVIGNGMAGARTVEEILRRGGSEQFQITMLGEEPHGNYNRILLSSVLNGSQDAKDIFLNPLDWYEENNVELRAGVRAQSIDREAKRVLTNDCNDAEYDQLIFATGSRPFVPPMEGLATESGETKPGVFVFRTLDDCRKIAGYATKCRRAAVIGGGLLGLEAARGLINYGCEVHVIHLMPRLMEVQLDDAAGAMLKNFMVNMGVRVHLEKSTKAVLGDDMVTGLQFSDGTTLPCDMVIISCGIKPNVELARECGLNVERAIAVDDQMRTSDPNIFAVGECAQHRGRVYGLVAPLWEQGKILADAITNVNPNAAYKGSKIATKLKVMGCDLAVMGTHSATDERDEEIVWSEPKKGRYKKLVIRDDKLIGAILVGETSRAGDLTQLFEREAPLPDERENLLFDLSGAPQSSTLHDMPDSAQICNCNGVSKGTLKNCVLNGTHDAEAVMRATRAGMGCGSCRKLVKEVVQWAKAS
jgi:nitrite reductase (NADH) large subunit